MTVQDLLQEINNDVKTIVASSFKLEVDDTSIIPIDDDGSITGTNLEARAKSCKCIKTCVLYVDIRKSTELNLACRPKALAKLYTAFIRSMIKASEYYGGTVKNIVGDRVMVLFNEENCYASAVNTAVMLNSIAQHIINKHFQQDGILCGIGIDYGKILIDRTGIVQQDKETQASESLIWLGKPANIASKLTDEANKTVVNIEKSVLVKFYDPDAQSYDSKNIEISTFLKNLTTTLEPAPQIKYSDLLISSLNESKLIHKQTRPPILMTEKVYKGFIKAAPEDPAVTKGWFKKQNFTLPDCNGNIYGGNVIFSPVTSLE